MAIKSRRGGGKNIVIIPGLLGYKEFYDGIWDINEYKNFSILILDLVGFGDSSKPKTFSYSMEEQAEISKLVIEMLNLKKINLICHSMGGAIGLLLYEKMPERITSFLSLEGCLIGEDLSRSREAAKVSYSEFEKRKFKQIVARIKTNNNESQKFWSKWKCKSSPLAFYKSSKSLVKWCDSRKLLDIFLKLKIKKTYFYGDRNSGMPILNLIKGKSEIVGISNSGHFMMVDNPKELYSRLINIL